MRKWIFYSMFYFLISSCYGQLSGGINDGTAYGFTTIPIKKKDLSKIEGTPYYHQEFTSGTLELTDMKPLQVMMRYDVSTEIIEIKTEQNSTKVYMLPASREAIYKIGGDKFVHEKLRAEGEEIFGYFIEQYDGETVRLLKKPSAKFTEAERANTGYGKDKPARIDIEEEYFLVRDGGSVLILPLKHRQIRKIFDSGDERKYLSENKIRSEEDLVQFVSFLDR